MVQLGADSIIRGKRSVDVLDTAFKMFSHASIDSISMTDIADEARIGVATIYRYFGTKQNLLVLTATYELRKRVALVKKRFHDEQVDQRRGIDQIEFLLMGYARDYDKMIDMLRFTANLDQYFLDASHQPEALEPYTEAMRDLFEMLYHAFDLAIAQRDVSEEYKDRNRQVSGIMALMGAAQKYATNSVLCGDDEDLHKEWLIYQVKTYIAFLGGGSLASRA